MFTAPHRKAGVSFICTGMATELALRGEKVLLVDAHALLAVRTFSPRSVTALCKKMGPHHLWVLSMEETVGWRIDPKGRSSAAGALLRELERDFPYLLIDAPALSVAQDANLLSTSVYGTVIVGADKPDTRRAVEANLSIINGPWRSCPWFCVQCALARRRCLVLDETSKSIVAASHRHFCKCSAAGSVGAQSRVCFATG